MKINKNDMQEVKSSIREIFDVLKECIFVIDKDYKIIFANRVSLQLFGQKEEDIIGKKCHDFFHQTLIPCCRDDKCDITCPYNEVFEGSRTVFITHSHIMPDRTERMFEITATPVKDENGNVTHMIEILRDITEKIAAEDALWESETEFRALAEESPSMIFINKKGSIVYVNRKCEEIMGYKKEEFYSKNFDFMDLIAPESKELVGNNFKRHIRGEDILPCEYKLVTRDGRKFFSILTTKLIEFGGERAILGIVTDITERKAIEEALKESEKKYRDIVDNALVGVYKTNIKGDILYVNKALANIFEFESPEEMMRENVLARYENQNDREVLIEALRKTGVVRNFYIKLRTRTGKSKTALLSATLDGDFISGMIIDISEKVMLEDTIKKRIKELEEFYDMAVSRELRMKELKKEIARLNEELKKYKS